VSLETQARKSRCPTTGILTNRAPGSLLTYETCLLMFLRHVLRSLSEKVLCLGSKSWKFMAKDFVHLFEFKQFLDHSGISMYMYGEAKIWKICAIVWWANWKNFSPLYWRLLNSVAGVYWNISSADECKYLDSTAVQLGVHLTRFLYWFAPSEWEGFQVHR